MESSIAKFLWRQPACERLPTNVGRALLGSNLSKDSWLLQNWPARPGCHGAPRRRMFRRLAAAQRGAMFAPSLCAAKGRPGARQGRVFGRLAAPRRRRGCAFSAPPRGGGGEWSGFQPDRAHKAEIRRGECGRRSSTAPWCNGSTLVSKSSCRGSIPRGAPLSKCAGLRCAIGGFLREVPVVNLPG